MGAVTVNPPKTPVTKGSNGIAQNTVPNICKMPGPPAPFVPTPLPNIGKSGMSPQGYSTTVKIEGNTVAIQGSSFGSMGDIASKGLGGGMVSLNCEGPTKFIGPGSFDVKIEGKNVQYLGDPMMNNCGPSGSPPNAATMTGEDQGSGNASCAHDLELVEKNPDEKIAKNQAVVDEKTAETNASRTANTNAQNALVNRPKGARMSEIRRQAPIAAQRLEAAEAAQAGAERNVKSAQQEKEVADEIGGKSYDIKCKLCGEVVGDFDAASDKVAKEVKGSAGGFDQDQFNKLQGLSNKLLGGVPVHMAVPLAEKPALEAAHPSMAGKVQGHAI